MTETTKTVFEKYEIRKTKKQKTAFIEYVQTVAKENGYACTVESDKKSVRNIVIGSPEKAKVIYTAHYDTCPVMPFPNFITPKNFLIYLLYQLLVTVIFMLVPAFAMQYVSQMIFTAAGIDPTLSLWVFEITLFSILFFIMFGPANKHTANDNTSGVTALLDLMIAMPEELRAYAAFVFFDCEETGLVGSSAFAKKHKEAHLKPLVNFDCVSDGNHILFAMRKDAVTYASMLKEAFPENESCKVEILSKGVFYPSDQAKFKKGIGVAALKKSKHGGILYMDRIHTKHDTVYREENVDFLTKGAIRLTEIMSNT
jgi:hypothetical protein